MKKYIVSLILVVGLVGCGDSGSSSSSSDSVQSVPTSAGGANKIGKGGSQARFVISGDYLYTLNKRDLEAFDITEPDNPLPYTRDSVSFDVETLFSYGKYLYIGAEGGIYIYTKPTPSKGLEKIGEFTHVKSCDPVVVANDLAFVTLNSGSSCRLNSGKNALEVLDVKDPLNPKLLMSRNMIEPKGLGIDDNRLFICDGVGGLKVFDVVSSENNESNETKVNIIFDRNSTLADINCYDLIPYNKNLIVSNGDDVRQFDYSHFPMVELGRIK
jgi:hypothetical protein